MHKKHSELNKKASSRYQTAPHTIGININPRNRTYMLPGQSFTE